jgi:hypothetical protein
MSVTCPWRNMYPRAHVLHKSQQEFLADIRTFIDFIC